MDKAFFDYKGKIIEFDVFEGVYEPAEDSFLLAHHIKANKRMKALDVGCGSGIASVIAAKQGADVTAVDIHKKCLENTQLNAEKHGVKVKTLKSNLFRNVKGKFDLILFNPPYVPSTAIDRKLFGHEAWAGGEKGREIIDRFLKAFEKHLNKKGRVLMINSSKNDIALTKSRLTAMGLEWMIVDSKKFFFEELFLFEIIMK